MLSSILSSSRAIQVNIEIMRTFVRIKTMASNYQQLERKIKLIERKYDRQFKGVFDAFVKLWRLKQQQK
jgi:hypothetical protein